MPSTLTTTDAELGTRHALQLTIALVGITWSLCACVGERTETPTDTGSVEDMRDGTSGGEDTRPGGSDVEDSTTADSGAGDTGVDSTEPEDTRMPSDVRDVDDMASSDSAAPPDTAMDTMDVQPAGEWYVDATTGVDTNTGSSPNAPFATITRALSVAAEGNTVRVAPGTYDEPHGESFPMKIPDGVRVIGNEDGKGEDTIIAGTTRDIVMPGAASLIAGFKITTDYADPIEEPRVVLIEQPAPVVRNNTIDNVSAGTAIYTTGSGTGGIIEGNVLTGNAVGFLFQTGGARVESNIVRENRTGVSVQATGNDGGDMGGGPAGSTGGNVIACNTSSDLESNQPVDIRAENNFWDHVPPTVSQDRDGADIVSWGGATISTSGAMLAELPCP